MRSGMGSKTGVDGSDDLYCWENTPINSTSSIDSNPFSFKEGEKPFCVDY